MHERCLPAAPNWYCSRCSDVSEAGLFGFGAKNTIYLVQVSASSCRVTGELLGHKDLVSSFSFCHHSGQTHICVSSSCDGTVRFWDTETKCLLKETSVHQKPVSAVHWSPADKNLVLSGDEKGVVVCHWFNTGDINTYFPEPRTIFCLSCSPHNWSHVAVGYKDGMIVLIDISKKGEVLHRLRGHDDEIHSLSWNPEPGEDVSCIHVSLIFLYDLTPVLKGCLLASGSRDQTLRIWSTDRGKSVMMLKLPYLKKRGSVMDPGVKERLWVNVHWPKGRRTHVISSCFSGELLLWDLLKTGKQKWSLFGSSSDGQNHNRIVFNMSSVQTQEQQLLLSTSMDREIKCWDMSTLELCWTLPSLGGFVYSLCFSPLGSGSLALGVGDNLIRVWNTQSSKLYDTRCFWQGIKSKVTALAWHPQKEGALAFGTDDGKVGIYGVFSNKPPEISSSYHKKTVYTLAWGPPVPPLSFGSSKGKSAFSLYSCAGEGTVLQHDPHQLSGEAFNIDKLIKDTNNIQHKLPLHTDLSWKPDGKVLAIGNEDGCIDVYEAPSLRLLCSIQQHHKIINCLRWHHGLHSPELSGLLASGSSNAIVYIHNLKQVLDSPGDSPVVISEPFRRLCGHTAKITGMSWSHHHDDRLVTVSYDGTAQVWDVLQEAPVSNYRGHHGNLLCVNWSPLDPDVVWTGGKDFTVHEWRVSKQEFDKPPKGEGQVCFSSELSMKKKKPRSILPLSTSMDHRPKDELLQDCTTLASVTHSGDHVHLGLFSDREALHRMFEAEEEAHLEAGHFESAVYLRLWSGDLQGALQLATEKGELSDHLLSLAPMAGFCVWSAAVDSYVKQLCLQEQFVKAASHLLSINKLHEAVDLLRSHRLYRSEAIALVKARLPQDDPVLKELYQSWAAVLEKDGFSPCYNGYLAAGSSFDAVKVISRKNEVSSIRAAADVAQICGEATLFRSLSLRCAKELSQAQDWSSVQDVLQNQDALLVSLMVLEHKYSIYKRCVLSKITCISQPICTRFSGLKPRVFRFKVQGYQVSSSIHLDKYKTVLFMLLFTPSLLQMLFFPFFSGDIAVFSSQKSSDTQSAAALSLQSFVRYLQMYELWWSSSLANGDGIVQSGAAGTKEEQEKEFSRRDLGFEVLLCESTAAAQSVQRAVGEIQDKLSALVTKHQTQGQEGEEERQNGVTMATHRQETTGFPRPDVLECSLVLLLLGRSSSVVSETLKCKSTDLLRRFGMSSCYFKAAQKLTST
uniref:Uncharacterized protein n=1 Tax=Periophthalmus magnuspinnatus TaxID=409849 RepID=A0A3B4BNB8_9GOBI